MSLDAFITRPNDSLELPIGESGERLHEWIYRLSIWRRPEGLEGRETGGLHVWAWVESRPAEPRPI